MRDYLGWKYGSHYEGSTIMFDLEPDKHYDIPTTFFKYYALSKNSVDALINLFVYASHPELLNDPFDCDMQLAKIEDDANAKVLWEGLFSQVRGMFGMDEQSFFHYSTEAFTTLMFRKWGILSLTDNCNNPIMWSSYANNNGFCLEWDVRQFPFAKKGPFPIHYVEKVEEVSSKDYDVQTMIFIQSNVKLKDWAYENEWRLMIQPPVGFDMKTFGKDADKYNQMPDLHDRKFRYPLCALKSITLGINFFKDITDRQQVISFVPCEYHFCYQNSCLQTKLLNFLDRLGKISSFAPIPIIRLRVKEGLSAKVIPIEVVKINELTYRIIETKN